MMIQSELLMAIIVECGGEIRVSDASMARVNPGMKLVCFREEAASTLVYRIIDMNAPIDLGDAKLVEPLMLEHKA